mgnify:CR=1 FL=1
MRYIREALMLAMICAAMLAASVACYRAWLAESWRIRRALITA